MAMSITAMSQFVAFEGTPTEVLGGLSASGTGTGQILMLNTTATGSLMCVYQK